MENLKDVNVKIVSDLDNIERYKNIEFSLHGTNLTIHSFSVSLKGAQLGFITGEVKPIALLPTTREWIMDEITAGLKSGKIQVNKLYPYREFKETFLLPKHSSSQKQFPPKEIDEKSEEEIARFAENGEQSTTLSHTFKRIDHVTEPIVPLWTAQDEKNVNVSSRVTTKGMDDFNRTLSSTNHKVTLPTRATTEEMGKVMKLITATNSTNGITIKNIFCLGKKPKGITTPTLLVSNLTDREGPKLPEIPETFGEKSTSIATIAMLNCIMGGFLTAALVGCSYFMWRKKRSGRYIVNDV